MLAGIISTTFWFIVITVVVVIGLIVALVKKVL